jgi:membrane protein implicated in regulation of membrane protease activity
MIKALADILWLVAFAIFFMMLASASFFLFLIAIWDWWVIPVALVAAGIIYLASRWLDNLAQPDDPAAPKPKDLLEMMMGHFNSLRGK